MTPRWSKLASQEVIGIMPALVESANRLLEIFQIFVE
jgi:hypothetical protein